MEYKIVRNYQDANKLIDKGYRMLKIDRDKRDRNFFVFLFEYSEGLISDLKKLEK